MPSEQRCVARSRRDPGGGTARRSKRFSWRSNWPPKPVISFFATLAHQLRRPERCGSRMVDGFPSNAAEPGTGPAQRQPRGDLCPDPLPAQRPPVAMRSASELAPGKSNRSTHRARSQPDPGKAKQLQESISQLSDRRPVRHARPLEKAIAALVAEGAMQLRWARCRSTRPDELSA